MPLRKLIPAAALAGLVILSGCKLKKPPVPPAQAQAPTITAPSEPAVPQPVPETKPAEPVAQPAVETPPPEPAAAAPKPKSKPRAGSGARKSEASPDKPAETLAPAAPARPSPAPRAAAPAPPQPDPTLVTPGLPHNQALHDRMTTDLLLQATEQNLAGLPRGLSSDQQGMVQQVRVYMQQSRGALEDGDPVRARNLALKAHLLSDELAKR